jgi:hypothetical protein
MITQKYANNHGYTDAYPFEIVRVVTDKALEIRSMNATLDPTWKPDMIPGGFAAHTTNNHSQRWIYESNPTARVIRIRLHKNGQWKDSSGSRYVLADKPLRFHDYNF